MSSELFDAIDAHHQARIADLLSRGADPNAVDDRWGGWTPLLAAVDAASDGGPLEVLKLLLQHGADANGWDPSRDTNPLLLACHRNNTQAVALLLDQGADPNIRGGDGDSPLRRAVEHGNLEMTKRLLQAGADKSIDEFGGLAGLTALGIAARQINLPMIELLLDAGANPKALDDEMKTARERLPPREQSDPQVWDQAIELLGRVRS